MGLIGLLPLPRVTKEKYDYHQKFNLYIQCLISGERAVGCTNGMINLILSGISPFSSVPGNYSRISLNRFRETFT